VAEAEKRWTMRTRNRQEIMAQLSILFQERLEGYLC
jgi:transposase-like protein